MDTLITLPVRLIKGSIILKDLFWTQTESLSWLLPGMSSVWRAQQTSHDWTPSPPHTWRSHWTPQAGLGLSLKMHNGWTLVTNSETYFLWIQILCSLLQHLPWSSQIEYHQCWGPQYGSMCHKIFHYLLSKSNHQYHTQFCKQQRWCKNVYKLIFDTTLS